MTDLEDEERRWAEAGAVPCPNGHPHEIKTIGLMPRPGETYEQTYVKWSARYAETYKQNPWCWHPLTECPASK